MNSLNCFIDPKATVHIVNGKWYYSYDKKHYEPIIARFEEVILYYDDSGFLTVVKDARFTRLSLSGECVDQKIGWSKTNRRRPPTKDELETNYHPFRDKSGNWGVQDLDGNGVVPPYFEEARMVHKRIVSVKLDGHWDIILLDEESQA